MDKVKIPQKCSFRYADGITSKLKPLKIGEYVEVPHSKAKSSYNCANQMGIKICTRKISEMHTRVYRIE